MGKIKVSIVEDIEDIRQGLGLLINSNDDFECIGTYSSSEDILADIENKTPDVIIMDIGLPGMSGIECTRLIKDKFPAIQIMICSVYEDDERLFAALVAGANGYILKRTSPEILLQSIKEIYQGGSPMSSHIARKVVVAFQSQKPILAGDNNFNLSKREIEILNLLSEGFRNKEIAKQLYISVHTVRSHIYNIYEKLHVQSRVEALNKFSSGK